jgi:hypothetical protein
MLNINTNTIGTLHNVSYIDAASFGFLPSASAAVNTLALNNALANGGNVYVKTPGVYDINDTIYIPSNTTLTLPSVFNFRKTVDTFGPVLMNKGALTGERNTNIKIYGNDCLFCDLNGKENEHQTVFGMRGVISFLRVDNFVVDDIHYVGSGTFQFFFQLCDVTNGIINKLNIESNKDGIDIVGLASDITITNLITKTADDGVYIGSFGYPSVTPLVGDCKNISITDWTDEYVAGGGGSALRMQCSAWLNWASGNSYQVGDAVTNAGHIYRVMNVGSFTAANAPIHTSGVVTGADGIQWRCLQAGTITSITIDNITVKNLTMNSARRAYTCDADILPLYTRTIYPGAFGNNLVNNITFNNVVWTQAHLWSEQALFVLPSQNIGTFTFKNSTITQLGLGGIIYTSPGGATQECAIDTIVFDNCNIDLSQAQNFSYGICMALGSVGVQGNLTNFHLLNSTIKGKSAEASSYLIRAALSTQFNNILIQNTTLDNLERFSIYTTGNNQAITMINSVFTSSKYFLASTATNCILSLNATNNVFNDPTQYLFLNNQSTSSVVINTSGSSGTITGDKIKGESGGGTVTITGDLPTPLLVNLVSYWKLDETSGNALDSKSLHSGSLSGAIQNIAGKIGKCYSFDGSSKVDFGAITEITGAFSVSLWAKRNTIIPAYSIMFGFKADYGGLVAYENGNINLISAAGSLVKSWAGLWTDKTGWHHIVLTVSETVGSVKAVYLYFDGIQQASIEVPAAYFMTNFKLGDYVTSFTSNWNGYIDEVALYNRELNTIDVSILYNSNNGRTYPFLW